MPVEYLPVELQKRRHAVYQGMCALVAKAHPLMILRVLLLVAGLGAVYFSLAMLKVHLYVTLLLLFLCAGPLSYLVFREEPGEAESGSRDP